MIYRKVANGNDYYAMDEHLRLTSSDNLDEVVGHTKFGKWTTDENMIAIAKEADSDEGYGFVIEKPVNPLMNMPKAKRA